MYSSCLSPLVCIGKSLAVKGKTGTENIKDGALHKRTIFSFSLTAAAFPDGVCGVERQSQGKTAKIVKDDFKGEENLSPLASTMPPTRHEGRYKICLECYY